MQILLHCTYMQGCCKSDPHFSWETHANQSFPHHCFTSCKYSTSAEEARFMTNSTHIHAVGLRARVQPVFGTKIHIMKLLEPNKSAPAYYYSSFKRRVRKFTIIYSVYCKLIQPLHSNQLIGCCHILILAYLRHFLVF